jgi:uncharacterized protein YchJ
MPAHRSGWRFARGRNGWGHRTARHKATLNQSLARPIDADHAEVEFVARSRLAGRGQRLHERSRFVREEGRWFYVDGDLLA